MLTLINVRQIKYYKFYLLTKQMNSYKNIIVIHFSAYACTNFGQTVTIVGNCPQLGMWDPKKGLKLQTTPKQYPIWFSKKPINLQKLTSLEYKLCVVNREGQTVRWENLKQNRNLSLKTTCSIFLTDGQPQAQYDFQNSETTSTQINSTKKANLSEIEQESDDDDPSLGLKSIKMESFQNERKRSGSSKGRNWISMEEEVLNDNGGIKLDLTLDY